MLPVVVAERRKAEAADNSFVLRPAPGQGARFPAQAVREAIGAVLAERFAASAAKEWKYTTEGTKAAADAIKARLKALGLPRYKFVVQLFVGENRGQGFKLATRALWDPVCDDMASESVVNDNLFAVAVVYGVYIY